MEAVSNVLDFLRERKADEMLKIGSCFEGKKLDR